MAKSGPRQTEKADMSETENATFMLPANSTHEVTGELFEFLKTHRGVPILINGAASGQVGAQIAQLIMVAARTWDADHVKLSVLDPSGDIAESLETLGLADFLNEVLLPEGATA
jgi:hypothetical protein